MNAADHCEQRGGKLWWRTTWWGQTTRLWAQRGPEEGETPEELAQGEQEMQAAQRRLEEELATGEDCQPLEYWRTYWWHIALAVFPKKQNLFRNLEDSPEMQNVLDGPLALRKWLRSRTRIKEIGAIAPDPALQLKGVLRMTRKTLDLNRELQFRVSSCEIRTRRWYNAEWNQCGAVCIHTTSWRNFSNWIWQKRGLLEEINRNRSRKKLRSKKFRSWKKIRNLPTEKRRRKFYLSEQGRRRGKACAWSHDQRDDRRRCWTCGSTEHMAPQCPRPKDKEKGDLSPSTGHASPSRPRLQKVERQDSSSTSSKTKDEDAMSETAAMKELLEQATSMLKSLTTSSTSSTPSGTSAKPTEEMMFRLQQQLDQLKLKVFKINRIKQGGPCWLRCHTPSSSTTNGRIWWSQWFLVPLNKFSPLK